MPEVTVLYTPRFLEHKPPYPHPENPSRLYIALKALKSLGALRVVEPRPATLEDLLRVHDPEYIETIRRIVEEGLPLVDNDTYASPGTMSAALAAAGAAMDAVRMAGDSAPLALVRPPGHHAGRRGRAMGAATQGFCIFNNVAVATMMLLSSGCGRVAIVDFDAHHGNGTQEIFYSEPRVLHIDLHEDPASLYPGTGFPSQLGSGEAEGTKVNVVLPPGSADDVYLAAIEEVVVPLLEEFEPEALLFSAGFDAFEGDGLAHLRAGERTFYELGRIPRTVGVPRAAAVLEGGYSAGLSRGLPAFALALAGTEADWPARVSREAVLRLAQEYLAELKYLLRRYWRI
uniref:Histone deacetylase family protein n=1 Tax=Thermofilum pendens TaxID=2269 RepID=A0A7C3WU49_THEPE